MHARCVLEGSFQVLLRQLFKATSNSDKQYHWKRKVVRIFVGSITMVKNPHKKQQHKHHLCEPPPPPPTKTTKKCRISACVLVWYGSLWKEIITSHVIFYTHSLPLDLGIAWWRVFSPVFYRSACSIHWKRMPASALYILDLKGKVSIFYIMHPTRQLERK